MEKHTFSLGTISYKNLCQDHYRRFETTNNPLKLPPTSQCWEWDFENWCNFDCKGGGGGGGATKLISIWIRVWQRYFVTDWRHVDSTQIAISQNHCIISKKNGKMKFIFCIQINIKLFYKLILSILVDKGSHAQSTVPKITTLQNMSIKYCKWLILFEKWR